MFFNFSKGAIFLTQPKNFKNKNKKIKKIKKFKSELTMSIILHKHKIKMWLRRNYYYFNMGTKDIAPPL